MFSFLKSRAGAKSLSARDAVDLAAQGRLTVIDVRDAAELRSTGIAAPALHIPMALLASKADPRHPDHAKDLTFDRPIAIYCVSGGRSGVAAAALQKLGYTQVHNIGGLADWVRAGGPVRQA